MPAKPTKRATAKKRAPSKATTWAKRAKPTGARTPPPVNVAHITPRAALFVTRYLVHLNATWAAREAGYSGPNTNKIGYQLLRQPLIAAAIAAAMDARAERTKIDQDFVVNALVDEATYHGAGAKHASRVSALELLGKHVRMFATSDVPAATASVAVDLSPIEAARRIAFTLTLGAQAAAQASAQDAAKD
jgi:phage terminase small subunit